MQTVEKLGLEQRRFLNVVHKDEVNLMQTLAE
jgi:hypothetical protein